MKTLAVTVHLKTHYRRRKPLILQGGKFLISGGLSTATHLLVFSALMFFFSLGYLWAATLGFVAGFIVSFSLQKNWTFRGIHVQSIAAQITSFFALQVVNLALNTAGVYVLVSHTMLPPLLAQILVLAALSLWTFLIAKTRIFR